jgi:hypothetical protein
MIRCLEDKTLFLLSEGEASAEQRSHLQSCQACTERYREIERDLRLITHTLQQEPAQFRFAAPRAPIFLRSLPIAAGVLLAIALMWGESRLWRPNPSSEQALNGDVSQFLEQVSEAIFDRGSREVETASSESDLASSKSRWGKTVLPNAVSFYQFTFHGCKSKAKSMTDPL